MTQQIRVLHITEMLSAAGIESFIMNIYRNIDKNKVQFDFLVLRDQHEFYDDEIKRLGGRKYSVHSNKKNALLRVLDESTQIRVFLLTHHYDIVHIHYTTPLRALYLWAAKKANVSTRIYHSHSAYIPGKGIIKTIVYKFLQHCMPKWGTDFFACSNEAANWMYDKKLINSGKVEVIPNGIDIRRFSFNKIARDKVRKKLGLAGKYVIIHTGRLSKQKNQLFLLRLVNYLNKHNCNVRLLLLGKGKSKKELQQYVCDNHLGNLVEFLGVKDNVQNYLSASDCYVMPSLYEGLPVAGIEAQCNGLPSIFSTNITTEVKVRSNVNFISLNKPLAEWCKEIMNYKGKNRVDGSKDVIDAGYDVNDIAKKMENFYLRKGNNENK